MSIIEAIRRAMGRAWDQTVRGRTGTRVQCDGCRQWVQTAYLVPIPGEAGGVELKCEDCRKIWHQAIRDLYAHRAAEQAAARYDRERREAA